MQKPLYYCHPTALVEPAADIGEGTRVWAFAHVLSGARVGKSCNICDHVFIESGVRIGDHVTVKNGVALWYGVSLGDYVFIGPNCVFTNDKNPRSAYHKDVEQFLPTEVCEGATIGANATIVCGVRIGRHAFIGAGAVVTRDTPDHALVVGNPAHIIGYMCRCGERLSEELHCGRCELTYELSAEGLTALADRPRGRSMSSSA